MEDKEGREHEQVRTAFVQTATLLRIMFYLWEIEGGGGEAMKCVLDSVEVLWLLRLAAPFGR